MGDKAALSAFVDMLRGTIGAVDAAIKAGKTLDHMKQEKVLAPWEKWASGFINLDRWTETIYGELHGGPVPAATSTQHH